MTQQDNRLEVFISYSRRDSSALAEELVAALEVVGFDAVLDRHDIAAAEDWEVRLETLIQSADSVIFMLSPEAVKSPRCAWEVNKAVELSKRLIPVVARTVRDEDVPEPLRRLNYVFFSEGYSFARALGQVVHALREDLDWIREHTRIAESARRWIQRGQLESLLLRDEELAAAQAWKAARRPVAPELTDAHLAFLAASVDAQASRTERERQQRDEFAGALTARAEALADRERATRTMQRRTVLTGIGAGVFSLGFAALGTRTLQVQQELSDQRVELDKAHAASLEAAVTHEAGRTDIQGQLTAFAASPGQLASDGVSGETNSPYTTRLLAALGDPNASLQAALSRAGRGVLELTKSAQRPFLASDLNGEIYLRRQPASRQCKALVVAVDQAGPDRFNNVLNDGKVWTDFLRACGFEVSHLPNPTHQQLIAAIDGIRFAGAPERLKFGVRPKSGPAPEPPGNSCVFFFYSGGGVRDGRNNLLLGSDTINQSNRVVAARTLDVDMLSQVLREAAAASVLVLDTAFPDPRDQ